ncbi:MAG TPA: hypothetical protein PJ997_02735 [Candidatus Paceibacterota bacterium]|nr:hypothetical protein [Candidatus Paceibacterota bacterium]HMP19228.1 hypothetical protein [Candidatus Paceibacterota bacterium]HMP85512.1 hypothetical protein [Candidatus Paceibacterota bacterium]
MKNNIAKNSSSFYIFSFIFGIVGIGVLVFFVSLTINQINFINSATKSVGQVIELREKRDNNSVTY